VECNRKVGLSLDQEGVLIISDEEDEECGKVCFE